MSEVIAFPLAELVQYRRATAGTASRGAVRCLLPSFTALPTWLRRPKALPGSGRPPFMDTAG
jgi:hypothetical protein